MAYRHPKYSDSLLQHPNYNFIFNKLQLVSSACTQYVLSFFVPSPFAFYTLRDYVWSYLRTGTYVLLRGIFVRSTIAASSSKPAARPAPVDLVGREPRGSNAAQ